MSPRTRPSSPGTSRSCSTRGRAAAALAVGIRASASAVRSAARLTPLKVAPLARPGKPCRCESAVNFVSRDERASRVVQARVVALPGRQQLAHDPPGREAVEIAGAVVATGDEEAVVARHGTGERALVARVPDEPDPAVRDRRLDAQVVAQEALEARVDRGRRPPRPSCTSRRRARRRGPRTRLPRCGRRAAAAGTRSPSERRSRRARFARRRARWRPCAAAWCARWARSSGTSCGRAPSAATTTRCACTVPPPARTAKPPLRAASSGSGTGLRSKMRTPRCLDRAREGPHPARGVHGGVRRREHAHAAGPAHDRAADRPRRPIRPAGRRRASPRTGCARARASSGSHVTRRQPTCAKCSPAPISSAIS